MFDVDFTELVVIFVVALIVLGPTRLPGLVSQIGRWMGKARSMARQFREQLESEVQLEELNRMTTSKPAPAADPTYPPPPPEFGGEPVATAAPEAATTEPEVAAPEDTGIPADDASHRDLSEQTASPDVKETHERVVS